MNSPVTIWRQHKTLHNYLNKVGKLVVWTKIFVAPEGFEHQAPYLVGIIQFDPSTRKSTGPSPSGQGEKLPLQIVDCDEKDLKINQKVKIVIRKIGKPKSEDVIEYGLKAKLV